MYSCTSLRLNPLVLGDTREPHCGMEFMVNGQYLVVIGSKDIFIITNAEGRKNMDKKIATRIIKDKQIKKKNKYFSTRYEYKTIKDVYCVNRYDKIRYQNQFLDIQVLCVASYSLLFKKSKGCVYIRSACKKIKMLIGDDELVYWYMILKLFLVDDLTKLIFNLILYNW